MTEMTGNSLMAILEMKILKMKTDIIFYGEREVLEASVHGISRVR
jgi:hypothetical protein